MPKDQRPKATTPAAPYHGTEEAPASPVATEYVAELIMKAMQLGKQSKSEAIKQFISQHCDRNGQLEQIYTCEICQGLKGVCACVDFTSALTRGECPNLTLDMANERFKTELEQLRSACVEKGWAAKRIKEKTTKLQARQSKAWEAVCEQRKATQGCADEVMCPAKISGTSGETKELWSSNNVDIDGVRGAQELPTFPQRTNLHETETDGQEPGVRCDAERTHFLSMWIKLRLLRHLVRQWVARQKR